MKDLKYAKTIFIIAIVFYVIYNTIYGWNLQPVNETEKNLDRLCNILIIISGAFYIRPLIKIYRDEIKKRFK